MLPQLPALHAGSENEPPTTSPEETPLDHHCQICPTCGHRLDGFRCKLICTQCGYYLSCADYY